MAQSIEFMMIETYLLAGFLTLQEIADLVDVPLNKVEEIMMSMEVPVDD